MTGNAARDGAPNEGEDLARLEEELGISELDVETIRMHEFFMSLSKSGFEERQALMLVSLMGAPEFDDLSLEDAHEGESDEGVWPCGDD